MRSRRRKELGSSRVSTIGKNFEGTSVSGSVAVLEALIAEKVDIIFGYPGGAIMPIYDALYDYKDKLEHILVRHEQGAIHAAQGYARTSGKCGCRVCNEWSGCYQSGNRLSGCYDRSALRWFVLPDRFSRIC